MRHVGSVEQFYRPGDQRAFALLRWAWIPVLVGVAVVLYAAVR